MIKYIIYLKAMSIFTALNVTIIQRTYNITEDIPQIMKGMIAMSDYGYRYPNQRQIQKRESCPCTITPLPANPVVAMLYVPMQNDTTMFDEMKALDCGTLFTVLNKPFAGKCCK